MYLSLIAHLEASLSSHMRTQNIHISPRRQQGSRTEGLGQPVIRHVNSVTITRETRYVQWAKYNIGLAGRQLHKYTEIRQRSEEQRGLQYDRS